MPAANPPATPIRSNHGVLSSCPVPWRVLALRLLAAADEPSSLAELAEAIDAVADQPGADWSGLLIIPGPAGPAAAVWAQPQPGNTARLWLPHRSAPSGPVLLRGAQQWAAHKGVSVLQAVIDTADTKTARLLSENGFPPLVDLLYLQAEPGQKRSDPEPVSPADTETRAQIQLEPIDRLPSSRLEAIVASIQDDSLDCPGLQRALSPRQAIEGFRHQGEFRPEHWCLLRYRGQDAGVLLMAPHPGTSCWELVYMGVVPGYRGHGLGRQLVVEALRRARNGGASQVLLSVDRRNHLARRLYEHSGFSVYASRSLYAWLGGGEGPDPSAQPRPRQ